MTNELRQEMRIIISGALTIFENDCAEIPGILNECDRSDLTDAYDAIGAALYWMLRQMNQDIKSA